MLMCVSAKPDGLKESWKYHVVIGSSYDQRALVQTLCQKVSILERNATPTSSSCTHITDTDTDPWAYCRAANQTRYLIKFKYGYINSK